MTNLIEFLKKYEIEYTDGPDGLTVGGPLDLRGTQITALPDGLTVGGYLDLRGTQIEEPEHIDEPKYPLSWQNGKYILIDGIFSEVVDHKGGVYRTRNIGKTKIQYAVTDGSKWAHGDTLDEAKKDLIYKISDRSTERYKGLELSHQFSFEEAVECYRSITGACAAGVRGFVESKGFTTDKKATIAEMIAMTTDQYGGEKFSSFFSN
jgi:hypothetical protein